MSEPHPTGLVLEPSEEAVTRLRQLASDAELGRWAATYNGKFGAALACDGVILARIEASLQECQAPARWYRRLAYVVEALNLMPTLLAERDALRDQLERASDDLAFLDKVRAENVALWERVAALEKEAKIARHVLEWWEVVRTMPPGGSHCIEKGSLLAIEFDKVLAVGEPERTETTPLTREG